MPIVQADRLTRIGAALLKAAGASDEEAHAVASGRKADASAVIEFISSSVKLSGDMTSGLPWVRYIKTLPQSPKKCGLPRLGRSALALSRSRKRSDTEPGA